MKSKKGFYWLLTLSAVGIIDSAFLTYEHYARVIVGCPKSAFIDCGKVTTSVYSEIFGVPLAVLGLIFYLVFYFLHLLNRSRKEISIEFLIFLISSGAFIFSMYFVYLQIFKIGAICIYCMLSAVTSTTIFLISLNYFSLARIKVTTLKVRWLYKNILKKIFFSLDAETVHEGMLSFGELCGNLSLIKSLTKWLFVKHNNTLEQRISDIDFKLPVGLAAGFDYQAKLTQFLPSLGFGFATVGSITNMPYVGNPKPRLGRLPKSKSLLVNKGFKNDGAKYIAKKMSKLKFDYAQGISIGRTNSAKLDSQRKSVEDIVSAFKIFEKNKVKNSYYELNISCPNLIHGSVDFYSPKNLNGLLVTIDKLKLKKPVFIKMPIEKSDKEVDAMLRVVVKHKIAGVIFGNLQKDKNNKSLVKSEVKKFKMGFYSGKPTWQRSNELIRLAYKKFGKKLIIVGCGGIFSARDAYTKIKLGASLVQLITGLIYEGPQLISEINQGLTELIDKDGFKNISEAIGVDNK